MAAIRQFWLLVFLCLLAAACGQQSNQMMEEIQLTEGQYGHTLNATQVFSADGQWIVYDTRNEDGHIGRTNAIEKVNVTTGEVVRLYTTSNQTLFGPGVGAASWNPHDDRVIFIHGLTDSNEEKPYGFTRRFGAIVNGNTPSTTFRHADARCIVPPFLAGALRGGTHAHTWSGDGQWISFTYNDAIMEALERESPQDIRDLRTIGVMVPDRPVSVPLEDADNFSGSFYTVVAAWVTENPAPGSNDIERAFDECWIGTQGYVDNAGTRHERAIAFQGNVRSSDGTVVTEVFVADINSDINGGSHPLQGTPIQRPGVPVGWSQRRLTFTVDNRYPGIQGPRVRLRTSPDGREIYFPMKDDNGTVQLFAVATNGGHVRQLTQLQSSLQWQFNVSPDGSRISMIAGNQIWLYDKQDDSLREITRLQNDSTAPINGVLWNPAGNLLVYNRYVQDPTGSHLQIFKIDLDR